MPLPVNVPRPDEPSTDQVARAVAILRAARNPMVLAGHGATRAGAGAALRRFAERLGIPVATTFHGKGVFPDDHPLALGAIGFMRHDYVNFGFDQADVVVTVGYELQEFDPVRINPAGDKQIIHIHRFPAEVDRHYNVAVGLQADIGQSLDALAAGRRTGAFDAPAAGGASAGCWPRSSTGGGRRPVPAGPGPHRGRHPGAPWAGTTSCWWTPGRSRCGWPASTPPTPPTPA